MCKVLQMYINSLSTVFKLVDNLVQSCTRMCVLENRNVYLFCENGVNPFVSAFVLIHAILAGLRKREKSVFGVNA